MPDIQLSKHLHPTGSTLTRTALALTALILLAQLPGAAADWGYDDLDSKPAGGSVNQPAGQEAESRTAVTGKGSAAAGKSTWKSKKNMARGPQAQLKSPSSQLGQGGQSRGKLGQSGQNKAGQNNAGQDTNETSLTPEEKQGPRAPTPEEIVARKKVDDLKAWMEVFALAASSASEDDRNQIANLNTLGADTRKKLETMLFEKLEQNVAEYNGISLVWQPVREKVIEDIDYKESYRLLFRALLRHAVARIEATAPEAEVIQEVLGPARIAEMGPPVLTEDAINAYSDMTCFLYQKRHPDHTVEGDDNRQLFAEVIRQRYNDAPNESAKKAMCNFDVTWASFRCRYLDATPAEKEKLITTIGEKDPDAKAAPAPASPRTIASARSKKHPTTALISPRMLKIFALGPWAESGKSIPVAVKMNPMSSPTK